jgi:hypothetical protein
MKSLALIRYVFFKPVIIKSLAVFAIRTDYSTIPAFQHSNWGVFMMLQEPGCVGSSGRVSKASLL